LPILALRKKADFTLPAWPRLRRNLPSQTLLGQGP
jgi:hypothetical protein